MSDDDHVFPQQILRGLGLLKTSAPSVIHPFEWHDGGGYWATKAGQSKPKTPPPGASSTTGEWVEAIPYGERLATSKPVLLTGSPIWIWYPLPEGAAQWMNGKIWTSNSATPPAKSPGAATPAPATHSWVTTAAKYWIWAPVEGTVPGPILEAP